jgi:alpha-tubulin suppressor-like RCC1 family protein
VCTWGCPDDNALGRANPIITEDGVVIPDKVTGFVSKTDDTNENGTIIQIAGGEGCIYCLSKKGNLYMFDMYRNFDDKKFGEPVQSMGNVLGTTATPAHIRTSLPVERVISSSSSNTAVAILSDRSIVTWGFGECGELGRSRDMTEPNQDGTFDLGENFYYNEGVPDPELVRAHFLSPKPPRWNAAIPYQRKLSWMWPWENTTCLLLLVTMQTLPKPPCTQRVSIATASLGLETPIGAMNSPRCRVSRMFSMLLLVTTTRWS